MITDLLALYFHQDLRHNTAKKNFRKIFTINFVEFADFQEFNFLYKIKNLFNFYHS